MSEETRDAANGDEANEQRDDSDKAGPTADADQETQSDMGLAAGGGTEADEGERVGAEDEETPPEQR